MSPSSPRLTDALEGKEVIICAGSGVPIIGAPDCMETVVANTP